jgi:hypothetical protein
MTTAPDAQPPQLSPEHIPQLCATIVDLEREVGQLTMTVHGQTAQYESWQRSVAEERARWAARARRWKQAAKAGRRAQAHGYRRYRKTLDAMLTWRRRAEERQAACDALAEIAGAALEYMNDGWNEHRDRGGRRVDRTIGRVGGSE